VLVQLKRRSIVIKVNGASRIISHPPCVVRDAQNIAEARSSKGCAVYIRYISMQPLDVSTCTCQASHTSRSGCASLDLGHRFYIAHDKVGRTKATPVQETKYDAGESEIKRQAWTPQSTLVWRNYSMIQSVGSGVATIAQIPEVVSKECAGVYSGN
jgi:hypothetical protein